MKLRDNKQVISDINRPPRVRMSERGMYAAIALGIGIYVPLAWLFIQKGVHF